MKVTHIATIAVMAGVLAANSSFGAAILGVNLTNTITASMDGGPLKNGNTWYEVGVNGGAPTTGIRLGLLAGQSDPFSDYLLMPANGNNALMLGTNQTKGSINFTRPVSVTGLSLAGASGNGAGTNTLTLRFSDGTSNTLTSIIVGDWFNNTNRVETANGRIDIFGNVFNNVSTPPSDNPRILAINAALATADQAKFLVGIDLSWSGPSNGHEAIFGVSGDVTGIGHYTAIPLTPGSFNQDIIVGLSEVPEPGSLALLGLGAACLLVRARRKNS